MEERNSGGYFDFGESHVPRHREREEEVLELLWTLHEDGLSSLRELPAAWGDPEVRTVVDRLSLKGLVNMESGDPVLTARGEEQAREIVRRQRLAESLLHMVLRLDMEASERTACKFEHILDQGVTDSVCTFLGHPLVCPHGKPIPRGECCRKLRREVRPLTTPLSEAEIGVPLEVVFISSQVHSRVDRLSALGIIPGSRIHLHQRHPSYVLAAGETTIAVDGEVAAEIYVKRVV